MGTTKKKSDGTRLASESLRLVLATVSFIRCRRLWWLQSGYAWNGLYRIRKPVRSRTILQFYADNIKYLNLMSAEEYAATIEAYMAPDEFAECDGSKEIAPGVFAGQQNRKMFGFSYKSLIGNDVDSNDYGYNLYLVYGCLGVPFR